MFFNIYCPIHRKQLVIGYLMAYGTLLIADETPNDINY